jgi:hypothetical protein
VKVSFASGPCCRFSLTSVAETRVHQKWSTITHPFKTSLSTIPCSYEHYASLIHCGHLKTQTFPHPLVLESLFIPRPLCISYLEDHFSPVSWIFSWSSSGRDCPFASIRLIYFKSQKFVAWSSTPRFSHGTKTTALGGGGEKDACWCLTWTSRRSNPVLAVKQPPSWKELGQLSVESFWWKMKKQYADFYQKSCTVASSSSSFSEMQEKRVCREQESYSLQEYEMTDTIPFSQPVPPKRGVD